MKKLEGGNLFNMGGSNVNNDVDVDISKSVNIVLKRKNDDVENELLRQTYYLKLKTVRKIKALSKASEMGISEVLQAILDKVLDNVDIE
jgi:hypothetical protein